MAHYTLVVPVERGGKTYYNRVGVMFENFSKDTGEPYYKMQLDYPVGATELLAFPPRPNEAASGEGATGQAPDAGRQPA